MARQERRRPRTHEHARAERIDGHAQRAFGRRRRVGRFVGGVGEPGHERRDLRVKDAPLFGQRHGPRAPLQEPHAHFRLEPRDGATDARLRQAERLGRAHERPGFDDRDENADAIEHARVQGHAAPANVARLMPLLLQARREAVSDVEHARIGEYDKIANLANIPTRTTPALDFIAAFEEYAAKGGLKKGDTLLTLDSRWTDTVSDTFQAAALTKPGKAVVLVVKRDGKELKLTVTPGKGL